MVTDKIVEIRQHLSQLRAGIDEFYSNSSPNSKVQSDLFLKLNKDIDNLQDELNEVQGETFNLLLKLKEVEKWVICMMDCLESHLLA